MLPFALLAIVSAACFHSSYIQQLACVQVTLTKAYAVNANFSGETHLASFMAPQTLTMARGAASVSLQIIAADRQPAWLSKAHKLSEPDAAHSPAARPASDFVTPEACSATEAAGPAGADMTNGVLDRVDFSRANLSGAKFVNAVVSCLRRPRASPAALCRCQALPNHAAGDWRQL